MKKIFVTIIILIALMFSINTVNAQVEIKENDELEIVLKLNNMGDSGDIGYIEGNIKYDEDVFEEIYKSDIDLSKNLSDLEFSDNKFIIKYIPKVSGEEELSITLRVKEDVIDSRENISIIDLKAYNGETEIELEDIIYEVQILENQSTLELESNESTLQEDIDMSNNQVKDMTILILAIVLIVLGIVGLILYIKIPRRDKKLLLLISLILVIAGIILLIVDQTDITNNYDVNNDGKIDESDVDELEKYLLENERIIDLEDENIINEEQENLESENQNITTNNNNNSNGNNLDVNGDGNVDLEDLGDLQEKLEKEELKSFSTSFMTNQIYYEKEQKVVFEIALENNAGYKIQKLIINNKEVSFKYNEYSKLYYIELNGIEEPGIQSIVINEIMLTNGETYKLDKKLEIEILKTAPSLEEFNIITNESSKQVISFNIKNPDNAQIASPKISIELDGNNIFNNEILVGENTIETKLNYNTEYIAEISYQYNRDTNSLNNDGDNLVNFSKTYLFRIQEDGTVEISKNGIDFENAIESIKLDKTYIVDNNYIEVTKISKNEEIYIALEFEIVGENRPKQIVIDNKTFDLVEKENGEVFNPSNNSITKTYYAKMPVVTVAGEKRYNIEKIIQNGGIEIDVNSQVLLEVLKEKPSVNNITTNINNGKLDINFNILDTDNTVSNLKIVIKDEKNKQVEEIILVKTDSSREIDISGYLEGTYTYNFVATYELEEGDTKLNQILETGEFIVEPKIEITNMEFNKNYIEKQDILEIKITLETNKQENIVGFVIDNKIVNATKNIDGTYTVEVNLSISDAGNKEIKISKAIFEDNVELVTNFGREIEILKDLPKINSVEIIENFAAETIILEFDILDLDSAFLSGNIVVKNELDVDILNQNIQLGKNSITIPVEIGKIYDVSILNTYKRDNLGTIQDTQELYNHKIVLIEEYNFNISNIKTVNESGNDKIYFNTNENYKIQFTSTNDSTYIPKKMTVNLVEYDVIRIEGTNSYYVQMVSKDISGVEALDITNIKLENNHSENIDIELKIENLKPVPTANEFNYTNLENGNIRVYIDIANKEAIKHYEVTVTDGTNAIYTNNNLSKDSTYIDFTPNISEEYNVIVKGNYDLDTNALTQNENEYTTILIEEIVELKREYIELKEVENVILYKDINGKTEKLDEVTISELNNEDYFVQVTDSLNNTRYADVVGYQELAGDLYLELDIDESVTYTNKKQEGTIVKYGGITNGIAKNIDFKTFVSMIANNPNSEITLTNDLDANDFNISGTTYINSFTGKINGNGYTISNLAKPLFNNLDGATIENITIDKAAATGQAILSVSASSTVKISDVHITNSSLTNGGSTGAFLANANSGSDVTIEYSSISNTYIKGGKRTGGMVGQQSGKLTITNSYIEAEIETTGDASGGVLGEIYGDINFDKIYADVVLQNTAIGARGGFIGYGGWLNDRISNSISLATGKDTDDGYKVWGSGSYILDNNYSLTESTLVNNNHSEVTNIERNTINKDFILNTLGWDENIWVVENLNSGEMPKLKVENAAKEEIKPLKDVVIPNYEYVSKLTSYNGELEIAYHNMNMLMPYLDSETIILYGNKITKTDKLNTVKIDNIYPIDNLGNLVVGLNTDTKNTISKIRIILEDGSNLEYNVTFDKVIDAVAVYEISELGIKYTYSKLIFNNKNSIYSEILSRVQAMDYMEDISSITPEIEDRLYKDFYNQYFVLELEEKVGNIFETMEEYTLTNNSENIVNKIRNDLEENNNLEAIIYTANYFERYYNFDIGIAEDFSDIIFWESDIYSDTNTNATNLVVDTLGTTEANRNKNASVSFYNNILKSKYSNKDIQTLLEKYILELDLNDNPDKWFVDQFEGIVVERKLQADSLQEVEYTAWNHLNRRNHLLLVTLSAPDEAQEDMYIIAVPSQIGIGSLNRYSLHLEGKTEELKAHIDNYADMILNYYETSASFTPNASYWLNKTISIQYDTRFNFPEAAPSPGTQALGTSEDPMYKWINEPIGMQMAANGSGAYANGTDTYWVVNSLLWSDYSFSVWTHESAHNQDDEYIYDGNGRRSGSGAEDHADYNNAQNMKEGHFTANMRYDLPTTSNLTTNLKLDRVYGVENIESFYDEMFNTLYLLDYLTAQAFFELTPEEQAVLVSQVFYLDSAGTKYEVANINTNQTQFASVTVEQIRDMNLQNMQDLWDNRLVFRGTATYGRNLYVSSTHYDILWYHPYNNEKMVDSTTFKRTGYEMLGVGGINGRFAYHSGMSNNDLEAIRTATGVDTMTWEAYKMGRWTEVENNLPHLDHFDDEIVKNLYIEALKQDALNGNRNKSNELRSILYNIIKHDTEDFDKGSGAYNISYQTEINSAQELIQAVNNNEWGSYILKNNIDFTGITINEDTNSYVENRFVGVLDGNNFSITGLEAPIFNEADYAHIKNVIFNDIQVKADQNSLIANTVSNSLVDNIKVIDINAILPLWNTKNGTNIELTETIYEITENEIKTLNDLLEIENSTDPLAKKSKYILANPIDVSSLSGSSSIISDEFSGTINGNGNKITGLTKPLFENLTGTVENLIIESEEVTVNKTTFGLLAEQANGAVVNDVTIKNASIEATSYDQIGTLFGYANNVNVENIKLENITLVGNNEAAGLIGKVQASTINQIEAINNNIAGKLYYTGGVIGRAHGTTIENIYSEGTVTITRTHAGGIVGALRDYSTLKSVVSNMEVIRPQNDDNRAENGGLVGGFENVNASILNSIQIADVALEVYKIVSPTNSSYSKVDKVYELSDTTGIIATGDGNKVLTITNAGLTTEFYKNTLELDENIWDFNTITSLGYPTLK